MRGLVRRRTRPECAHRRAHRRPAAAVRRRDRRARSGDDDGERAEGTDGCGRDNRRSHRFRISTRATSQARGSAPGSLKAGWTSYLTRGARAGEPVLTIEELLASGKLAPVSARRFATRLQPAPAGDALGAATAAFYRNPRRIPRLVRDPMDQQRLDALLYPANLRAPEYARRGARALR